MSPITHKNYAKTRLACHLRAWPNYGLEAP